MSSDVVLSVRNVSKCFEMYEKPVHRLYQTLCAGKKKFYKEFWALKDISFDVHRGECVGIIGRNGAGKSTLLQIITGTLAATGGSVDVNGRIAALLELGSGFNPEFTGRENVYLNASILGLAKEQIDAKYKMILDFADIGEFIDQPVKTYSSGMMVRLAFAVQVMVEADVLIVDEALAVGDAAFQAKCMSYMRETLANGRSILLVTHDISTIRSFCTRAIWLKSGELRGNGDTQIVSSAFLEDMFSGSRNQKVDKAGLPDTLSQVHPVVRANVFSFSRRWGTGEARIIAFLLEDNCQKVVVQHGHSLRLKIRMKVEAENVKDEITASFSIRNKNALDIQAYVGYEVAVGGNLKKGDEYQFEYEWQNCLIPGEYELVLALERTCSCEASVRYLDFLEGVAKIECISDRALYGLTTPICHAKCGRVN